jgi:hypothetical protein
MTRWALVVALVAAGCTTMETTRFVAPVLPDPTAAPPGQVTRDEGECATYAVERPSEIRYATYVACMVGRGHRTYASLVARQGATGITLQSNQRKETAAIYRELEQCARNARVRVDMPPHPDTFKGARAQALTVESQRPFADCLSAAGYSTTLHGTPEAVAMATQPPPPPGPVITAPAMPPTPTPTAVAPPLRSAPPASTAPTPGPAPHAAPPRTAPAVSPPPPRATAAMTSPPATTRPPSRPVKLGLYVEPGSKPPVIGIVASDTPAGRAGVRPGDVVLRIDRKSIGSEDDIAAALAGKAREDVVRIDLRRGAQQISVEAILIAQ